MPVAKVLLNVPRSEKPRFRQEDVTAALWEHPSKKVAPGAAGRGAWLGKAVGKRGIWGSCTRQAPRSRSDSEGLGSLPVRLSPQLPGSFLTANCHIQLSFSRRERP